MSAEGKLLIDLFPAAGAPNRIAIRSSRPVHAARIFETKSPDDVLRTLPLLFSVCGIAQTAAAAEALCKAGGDADGSRSDSSRRLLVLMETAREHLWRILLDWPALIDETAEPRRAASMQSLLPALSDAVSARTGPDVDAADAAIAKLDVLLERQVFGVLPEAWLAADDAEALADWSAGGQTVAARLVRRVIDSGWQAAGAADTALLPALSDTVINDRLTAADADAFVEQPSWDGQPRETTPLARRYDDPLVAAMRREFGHGLLTRLAALLVELAAAPAAMRALLGAHEQTPAAAGDLPARTGIGQVDAARGRLVHRAVLEDGAVRRYQILAPTEWNFHPHGVLAASLAGLAVDDEPTLRRQAAMLITAIDPCVGYELEVH